MRGQARDGIAGQAQFGLNGLNVLGKDNVDGHDVRIEAINAGTIDEIMGANCGSASPRRARADWPRTTKDN